MTRKELEHNLIDILRGYDAERIGIFGSHARDEARPGSDLDVLVTFRTTKSLLTLVRIERELSEMLGVKVDLLTEAALSPHLRESIESDLRLILQ